MPNLALGNRRVHFSKTEAFSVLALFILLVSLWLTSIVVFFTSVSNTHIPTYLTILIGIAFAASSGWILLFRNSVIYYKSYRLKNEPQHKLKKKQKLKKKINESLEKRAFMFTESEEDLCRRLRKDIKIREKLPPIYQAHHMMVNRQTIEEANKKFSRIFTIPTDPLSVMPAMTDSENAFAAGAGANRQTQVSFNLENDQERENGTGNQLQPPPSPELPESIKNDMDNLFKKMDMRPPRRYSEQLTNLPLKDIRRLSIISNKNEIEDRDIETGIEILAKLNEEDEKEVAQPTTSTCSVPQIEVQRPSLTEAGDSRSNYSSYRRVSFPQMALTSRRNSDWKYADNLDEDISELFDDPSRRDSIAPQASALPMLGRFGNNRMSITNSYSLRKEFKRRMSALSVSKFEEDEEEALEDVFGPAQLTFAGGRRRRLASLAKRRGTLAIDDFDPKFLARQCSAFDEFDPDNKANEANPRVADFMRQLNQINRNPRLHAQMMMDPVVLAALATANQSRRRKKKSENGGGGSDSSFESADGKSIEESSEEGGGGDDFSGSDDDEGPNNTGLAAEIDDFDDRMTTSEEQTDSNVDDLHYHEVTEGKDPGSNDRLEEDDQLSIFSQDRLSHVSSGDYDDDNYGFLGE